MLSLLLLNCGTCLIIKRWKYNPHKRCYFPGWNMCVCVCACLSSGGARSKTDRQITVWASGASKRSNTHKICQNGRLREYSLKHCLCLKWTRTVGRKSDVCQYIVLKWQTGAWTINVIKEKNAKRKSLTARNLNNGIALISINLSVHTVKTMQCSFTFDYF